MAMRSCSVLQVQRNPTDQVPAVHPNRDEQGVQYRLATLYLCAQVKVIA